MQSMEESHRLRESAEAALKLEIQQIQNGSVPTLTLTPSTVSSPVATPTSAVQNVHSLAPLAHTPMAAAVPAAVSPTATSPAAQRTLLFPPAAPGSPAAALQQALLAEATSQLLLQQQHQQVSAALPCCPFRLSCWPVQLAAA